jgi:hypothetical protein
MLRKLMASVGVVLLASSFAFAGQSATPPAAGNGSVTPDRPASAQTTAPAKHHGGKKHHKHHKKNSNPAAGNSNPAPGK